MPIMFNELKGITNCFKNSLLPPPVLNLKKVVLTCSWATSSVLHYIQRSCDSEPITASSVTSCIYGMWPLDPVIGCSVEWVMHLTSSVVDQRGRPRQWRCWNSGGGPGKYCCFLKFQDNEGCRRVFKTVKNFLKEHLIKKRYTMFAYCMALGDVQNTGILSLEFFKSHLWMSSQLSCTVVYQYRHTYIGL